MPFKQGQWVGGGFILIFSFLLKRNNSGFTQSRLLLVHLPTNARWISMGRKNVTVKMGRHSRVVRLEYATLPSMLNRGS